MKYSNVKEIVIQISLSTDFLYRNNSFNEPVCLMSSFDCELNFFDFSSDGESGNKSHPKHIALKSVSETYIKSQLLAPPLIYNVYGYQSSFLVSTETGHIYSFSLKMGKKPKYIIEAHLGRIIKRLLMIV